MAQARGKYAKAISDRSGMEFPYKEMVREWNGSFVHVSEFEPKQPQLEPKPMNGDSISLRNVRPDRIETSVPRILPLNAFTTTNGSTTISVNEPDHGRSTSDRVRFRDANVVGGVAAATINLAAGYVITKVDNDNYTFATGTTSSIIHSGLAPDCKNESTSLSLFTNFFLLISEPVLDKSSRIFISSSSKSISVKILLIASAPIETSKLSSPNSSRAPS